MPIQPLTAEELLHSRGHLRCGLASADNADPIDRIQPDGRIERPPIEEKFICWMAPLANGEPLFQQNSWQNSSNRGRPDRLCIAAEGVGARWRRTHHVSCEGVKFFGSNRDKSMPPRDSSSSSFTRLSIRSSRRAIAAGVSVLGVSGAGRGTLG